MRPACEYFSEAHSNVRKRLEELNRARLLRQGVKPGFPVNGKQAAPSGTT